MTTRFGRFDSTANGQNSNETVFVPKEPPKESWASEICYSKTHDKARFQSTALVESNIVLDQGLQRCMGDG